MPHGMDFAADQGRTELARLAKVYEFPEFVKKAELEATQRPARVAVTTFADPVRQQFHCHTKAATWINYVYFLEKKAEFHPQDQARIQDRFDSYVDYWGIRGDVDAVKAAWDRRHGDDESRRPDSDYGWIWVDEAGRKDRRLPLTTAMEVKSAAEWLTQYRDRFPFADRRAVAARILEKAAALGVGLGDARETLEKTAGLGVGRPGEIAHQIRLRAAYAKDPAVRDCVEKLAAAVEQRPQHTLQPARLADLAGVLDNVDRGLGLAGKYTEALARPEDVIFSATFAKAAAELHAHVATTTGAVYQKEALAKAPLDDLRGLLGDEFVERVVNERGFADAEKLAEEVAALPRPDAQLLETMLAEQGIRPTMRKAAAARTGLSDAQMRALAAEYMPVGV